jgi:hypothetical protein
MMKVRQLVLYSIAPGIAAKQHFKDIVRELINAAYVFTYFPSAMKPTFCLIFCALLPKFYRKHRERLPFWPILASRNGKNITAFWAIFS